LQASEKNQLFISAMVACPRSVSSLHAARSTQRRKAVSLNKRECALYDVEEKQGIIGST
jgi:hypothetical protein